MRLRNKPWAKDKINDHPEIIVPDPTKWKGKWHELFGNDAPIHIEIGTGRGQFIVGMAKQNPNINYIGIEKFDSVIVDALDKALVEELPNLKLLNEDANDLESFFEENELDRIYLNFSDPWPKNRHEKRRLTYKTFLNRYERVMRNGSEIHMKTDNQKLFEYSLVSFSQYGMKLLDVNLNLHESDFEGNIMTEYEQKFSAKGMRIYRCEAKFDNE